MTADIRTAAQREAEKRHRLNPDYRRARVFFTEGAVWGAARVTPTRDQIAESLRHGGVEIGYAGGHSLRLHAADAVLALMAGLAEGEK